MSTADAARRYRRLLWAYPGAYRRRHGAEIVTTLLEMAEAGRRPAIWQTVHLVACGLRQRFRLPRHPFAVIAALLAAAALGALGAVGGNWLAWQTAPSMPSTAETSALTSAAAGLPWPAVYHWQSAMNGPAVDGIVSGTGAYDAARVKTALTAAGWRITKFTEFESGIVVDLKTEPYTWVPARAVQYVAVKDGLTLEGETSTVIGGAQWGVDGLTELGVGITADVPGVARPLTIAGLAAGALGGWLLAAALAYRIRRPGHRCAAAWLTAVAIAAAGVPAFVGYCEFYQFMAYDFYQFMAYDADAPNQYVTTSPSDHIPAAVTLLTAALGVVALAAAAAAVVAARRRSEPELTPVSS